MIDKRYKNKLLALIEQYLPSARVYLYGSRARGDNRINSDIDIAIDAGAKADERKIARIRLNIEDLNIPFTVDVVDFHDVSEPVKKNIEKDKIVWKN